MSKTQYTVLCMDKDEHWCVLGEVEASSDKGAISKAAADRTGVYMAVPSRSWGRVFSLSTTTVSKLEAV